MALVNAAPCDVALPSIKLNFFASVLHYAPLTCPFDSGGRLWWRVMACAPVGWLMGCTDGLSPCNYAGFDPSSGYLKVRARAGRG